MSVYTPDTIRYLLSGLVAGQPPKWGNELSHLCNGSLTFPPMCSVRSLFDHFSFFFLIHQVKSKLISELRKAGPGGSVSKTDYAWSWVGEPFIHESSIAYNFLFLLFFFLTILRLQSMWMLLAGGEEAQMGKGKHRDECLCSAHCSILARSSYSVNMY